MCYTIFCDAAYNLLHGRLYVMCGRYQFTTEQCEEIRRIANAIQRKYGDGAWSPGEIRPCSHAPVLMRDGDGEASKLMKWGYQLPGTLVINARAETAQ